VAGENAQKSQEESCAKYVFQTVVA
jgi:hypothetical protein